MYTRSSFSSLHPEEGEEERFLAKRKVSLFFSFFFYYCDAGLGLDKGGKEGWEGR